MSAIKFSIVTIAYNAEHEIKETMLSVLDNHQREYVTGLPWNLKPVYHRLDSHMREILALLVPAGLYQGELFFLKTGERIRIAGDREGRGSDVPRQEDAGGL